MKTLKCTVLIFALGIATQIKAQEKPQAVYSIVKEYHPSEWYMKQYELWNKEVEKQPKNEHAWMNLYTAARMARFTSENDEKQHWHAKQTDVAKRMEKAIKGTYTYYDIMSWEYPVWDTSDQKEQEKIIGYSEKAYALNPNAPRVYSSLMNIYEVIKPNEAKKQEICRQWKKSTDLSPNLMALAYNKLLSTKKDAILLTAGDNDTYPLWVAQQADNFRKDVTVLNIFLIQIPEYRNRLFKQLGIPILEGENIDQLTITNHIIKHKKDHPLYFSNNGIVPEDSVLHENLYNIGVIYLYCEGQLNNTSIIVDNMENKLLLDHLKYNYYQSEFPEMDRRHNYVYLSALGTLYVHYKLIENKEKELATKELILSVAEGSPYLESIKNELKLD